VYALEGSKAPEIGARLGLCRATVRHWLKRFNACGLKGLEEDVRSGRPPTYSAEERSAVIDAALTRPGDLGLPFACWTLDRLVAYLGEQGIAMRRSRISEIFIQEGLRWRREEAWFGERGRSGLRAQKIPCGWTAAWLGRLRLPHTSMEATDDDRSPRNRAADRRPGKRYQALCVA
jgi:transposase